MIAGYFSSDSFYPLGCEIREVPLRGFRLVGRVFSMRVAKGISGGTCYAKRLKDELVEVAKNMDANVVGVDVNDGQFYYFSRLWRPLHFNIIAFDKFFLSIALKSPDVHNLSVFSFYRTKISKIPF